MSFLDQMKLPGLINLGLIFIMASNSKGETWSIKVNRSIVVEVGSNVTILCTFTYPTEYHTKDVEVYWKTNERSPFKTPDNEISSFVFHSNDSFVIEEYRGRTKLIGNKTAGNCSLQIFNVTKREQKIHLRVFGKGEKYSFKEKPVSIIVSDPGAKSFTSKPAIAQPLPTAITATVRPPSASMYTAIFVPVTILVILFVIGIVFYIRHKRSQSFTREESGYYANFSRASSNQAEREASCNRQENKKLPEVKAIDEPIYINTEAALDQMDQSMDDMDNVYANVDYTK